MRQSGSNITFSNVETHTIKAIEFGLMNPEHIVRIYKKDKNKFKLFLK